jgi:hypothetical protein
VQAGEEGIRFLLVSGKPIGRAYLGVVSNPVPLPEDVTSLARVEQEYGLMILSVERNPTSASGYSVPETESSAHRKESSQTIFLVEEEIVPSSLDPGFMLA